VPPAGQRCAFL